MLKKLMTFVFLVSMANQASAVDTGAVWQTIKDNPKVLICGGIAAATYLLDWKMEKDGRLRQEAWEEECLKWNKKKGGTKPYSKDEWRKLKKYNYGKGRNLHFDYSSTGGNVPFGYGMLFHSGRTGAPINEKASFNDRKSDGSRDVTRDRTILPYVPSYFIRNTIMLGAFAFAIKGKTPVW
jgi:hypothetical protein